MESDKFICVCENAAGTSNVVIINMTQNNSVTRRPIAAEAESTAVVYCLESEVVSRLSLSSSFIVATLKRAAETQPRAHSVYNSFIVSVLGFC
jgi:hypothetical protein